MAPKDNPNPQTVLSARNRSQPGVAGFGRPGTRAALLGLIGIALWVWLVAVQFRELPRNAWYRDALTVLLWGTGCLAAHRCARGWLARRLGRASVSVVPAGWSGRERVILVLGAGLMLFTLAALGHSSRFYFYSWPIGFRAPAHWPRQVTWHFLLLSWGFVLLGANPLPARLLRRLLGALLVAGQLVCVALLLRHTGFSAPYSDDHPSFLFRLAEFFGAFPWRENYVPYWNAGVVNSVITSSGVAGYALLGAPFWLLTEPHLAAPYALLFTFVLFVPWFTVCAFRAAGLSWTGALVGGLLMLCGSRLYFIWMLHFGTVGASLSGALLPAALAFLYAAVHRRPAPARRVFAGLFLALFLMGQWPPMLLLGLPMGLLAAAWRRWWRPAVRGRLLWTGLLVVGALLPTVAGALLGKTVMEHVLETPSGQGSCAARLWASFCSLTPGLLMDVNPLVLVAGAAGVWVMPWKRLRRWVVVVLLFLVLVFTAGPVCLPNMQLERMSIMAAGLLVLPAAAWLRVALEVPAPRLAAVRAAILALLVCSLTNVARVYAGRTPAAYTGIRPSIRALAAWIREQVPADGRLLFAGSVVHAYGRGHIAYLPLLAGREMMAADYYGFPAGMVEPSYPPEAFRRQSGGMEHFMRLHGVTHVITFRDNFIEHFRAHPADYEEVAVFREPLERRHNVYTVFKVRESGGRFRQGAGTVRAGFNHLTVSLDDPRAPQAVIAYNWDDRLSVAAPAQIAPVEVEPGVTFIGLRPNGARTIDIRYRSRF